MIREKQADYPSKCISLVKGIADVLNTESIHQDNYANAWVFVRWAEAAMNWLKEKEVDIMILSQNVGYFYSAVGDLMRAHSAYELFKKNAEGLLKKDPNNVGFKNGLAISYSKLGETHSALGDLGKALEYFEAYNNLSEQLHRAYPDNVGFKNGLAISYSKLGETHSELGDLRKALER